ncbi:LamG domain-containing protein [Comamonas aquatilis]|uniref:phage head spike fiber domain-containing protein n=1 Tax=Comamonas aquatilis TaxID=1778406 RepID=UPI0039EED30D
MSALPDFPNIRPRLLMDFANSRRTHPLLTCTRASAATCFGPDGKLRTVGSNIPRIDYDPVTGKCLGLLIEEARANLLLNSVFAGAVSGTPGTAPTNYGFGVGNGSTTVIAGGLVTTLRLSATAARHFLAYNNVAVAVGQYTFSVPCNVFTAAAMSASIGRIDGTAVSAVKYFIDGVEVTANTSNGLGRKKLSILIDVTTAGTINLRFGVGVSTGVTADIEIGTPQFELGSFATSPILTTTATATRAADNVNLDITLPTVGAVTSAVLGLPSGSTNNAYVWSAINPADINADHAYFYFSGTANTTNWWVNKANVGQSGRSIAGRMPNSGFAYSDLAKTAAIASGSLISIDATARAKDFPSNLTRLYLGRSHSAANTGYLNGCISRLAIYGGAITHAQLQRLTA